MSATPMNYDERYTPYIQNLGLLPFIHMVTRSTPNMNPAAITALVDRWRPETHSFHLWTGEMMVTLEGMAMILALPIEGASLCIDTSCDDWRGKMVDLIGKCPGDTLNKDGVKLRVAAGATFKWISDNFNSCPEDDDEDVVKIYARVYVWYVITRTLFNDASGKTAHWHWLKALTVMDRKWSWGTAALAWLYRQVMSCFVHSVYLLSILATFLLLMFAFIPCAA
jgi:hypothetical protein